MAFDPNKYDTENSFAVLPAGEYTVALVKTERKDTKSGEMLAAQFKITRGANKGRVIFHNFNLKNASDTAEEMAQNFLAQFLLKTGTGKIKSMWDVSKGFNKEVNVRLKIKKDDTYGDKNELVNMTFETVKKKSKSDDTDFNFGDNKKKKDKKKKDKKQKGKKNAGW